MFGRKYPPKYDKFTCKRVKLFAFSGGGANQFGRGVDMGVFQRFHWTNHAPVDPGLPGPLCPILTGIRLTCHVMHVSNMS